MIRVGIVEDQEEYRQQLLSYLQTFQEKEGVVFQLETFHDGYDFVERYDSEFDLLLMDIHLPLIDGMSAIEEIRKRDSDVFVIFITSTAQYAVKGYDVNAIGYILKPFNYYSLSEYLKKNNQATEDERRQFSAYQSRTELLSRQSRCDSVRGKPRT